MADTKIPPVKRQRLCAANAPAVVPHSVNAIFIGHQNAAIVGNLHRRMDWRGVGIVDYDIAFGTTADGKTALAFDALARLHMAEAIQNFDDYGVHLIAFTYRLTNFMPASKSTPFNCKLLENPRVAWFKLVTRTEMSNKPSNKR